MPLFAFERRWLLAIFAAILPSGADPRVTLGAGDFPLDRFVDDLWPRVPALAALGIRASLWAATLAPLAAGRLSLFPSLALAEQVALLERLAASRLHLVREIPVLLKTLACLGACGAPALQRQAGVAPVSATPPVWMRP